MKKYRILLLILVMVTSLNMFSAQLKLIKTIGDDRDNYTFSILNGAALSKDKEIFVLDGQGFYIARYSWSGEFLGRTGQKGQGPKDFYYPRCINICNDKVFILDSGNKRIAEAGLQLQKFDYYKMNPRNCFDNSFFALPNGTFIGNFSSIEENRGRIGIINQKGNVLRHFFSDFPVPIETDLSKLTEKETIIAKARHIMISKETDPIIALDEEKKNILVTYRKPANPIRFFVYSLKGELIKTFSYQLDSKYQFFDFYLKIKFFSDARDDERYPAQSFVPYVYTLFIHKNHYIVQLWLRDYKKKKEISKTSFLLIFDKEGNLKDKKELDPDLRLFSISQDGYILGSSTDEEIAKLYIYQLTL